MNMCGGYTYCLGTASVIEAKASKVSHVGTGEHPASAFPALGEQVGIPMLGIFNGDSVGQTQVFIIASKLLPTELSPHLFN